MLDEQDLKAIAKLIAESEARISKRFDEVDKRFNEVKEHFDEVDQRFGKMDKKFEAQIAELKEMDEFILTEVCNVYKNLDERITQIDIKLKDIQDYYRLHKFTDENTTLLLELYRKLEDRVTTIEKGNFQAL